MSPRGGAACGECDALLADDQRYCLECGARHGVRAPALERVLAGLATSTSWYTVVGWRPVAPTSAAETAGALAGRHAQQPAGAALAGAALQSASSQAAIGAATSAPQQPPASSPAPGTTPSRSPRPTRGLLPGPRVAAVLTLAALGFGTLAGEAASNPGSLAALRRGPLTLLIPAPAPSAENPATASAPPVVASGTPEPAGAEGEPSAGENSAGSGASGSGHGTGGSGHGTGGSGHGTGGSGHGTGGSGNSSGAAKQGASHAGTNGSNSASASPFPPIKHIFLIVLADEPYALTFGPESPAPYLAHTLEHHGALLPRFYAVAHEELPNEIALVSGLGPTAQTAADCPKFADILPSTPGKEGQFTAGSGCIYPRAAETIAGQLEAKHLSWRVYAQALGQTTPSAKPTACWHPEFNAADPTSQAPAGTRFATFLDPFAYFDGILHSPTCAQDDVGIEQLGADLRSAATTPAFSYIAPDLCDDGRPTPCVPGGRAGLPAAEAFLRRVVPEILAAPAYRKNGLLVITTDQAPATGEYGDSSACCGQPRFPAPEHVAVEPAAAGTTTDPGASTPTGATTTPGASAPTTGTAPAANGSATPAAGSTTPAAGSTTPATSTPASTTTAPTAPAAPNPNLPPTGGGQVGALLLSPYIKPGTSNQEPANDFSLLRTIEQIFGLPYLGYANATGASSIAAEVFSGG